MNTFFAFVFLPFGCLADGDMHLSFNPNHEELVNLDDDWSTETALGSYNDGKTRNSITNFV